MQVSNTNNNSSLGGSPNLVPDKSSDQTQLVAKSVFPAQEKEHKDTSHELRRYRVLTNHQSKDLTIFFHFSNQTKRQLKSHLEESVDVEGKKQKIKELNDQLKQLGDSQTQTKQKLNAEIDELEKSLSTSELCIQAFEQVISKKVISKSAFLLQLRAIVPQMKQTHSSLNQKALDQFEMAVLNITSQIGSDSVLYNINQKNELKKFKDNFLKEWKLYLQWTQGNFQESDVILLEENNQLVIPEDNVEKDEQFLAFAMFCKQQGFSISTPTENFPLTESQISLKPDNKQINKFYYKWLRDKIVQYLKIKFGDLGPELFSFYDNLKKARENDENKCLLAKMEEDRIRLLPEMFELLAEMHHAGYTTNTHLDEYIQNFVKFLAFEVGKFYLEKLLKYRKDLINEYMAIEKQLNNNPNDQHLLIQKEKIGKQLSNFRTLSKTMRLFQGALFDREIGKFPLKILTFLGNRKDAEGPIFWRDLLKVFKEQKNRAISLEDLIRVDTAFTNMEFASKVELSDVNTGLQLIFEKFKLWNEQDLKHTCKQSFILQFNSKDHAFIIEVKKVGKMYILQVIDTGVPMIFKLKKQGKKIYRVQETVYDHLTENDLSKTFFNQLLSMRGNVETLELYQYIEKSFGSNRKKEGNTRIAQQGPNCQSLSIRAWMREDDALGRKLYDSFMVFATEQTIDTIEKQTDQIAEMITQMFPEETIPYAKYDLEQAIEHARKVVLTRRKVRVQKASSPT